MHSLLKPGARRQRCCSSCSFLIFFFFFPGEWFLFQVAERLFVGLYLAVFCLHSQISSTVIDRVRMGKPFQNEEQDCAGELGVQQRESFWLEKFSNFHQIPQFPPNHIPKYPCESQFYTIFPKMLILHYSPPKFSIYGQCSVGLLIREGLMEQTGKSMILPNIF